MIQIMRNNIVRIRNSKKVCDWMWELEIKEKGIQEWISTTYNALREI